MSKDSKETLRHQFPINKFLKALGFKNRHIKAGDTWTCTIDNARGDVTLRQERAPVETPDNDPPDPIPD